MGIRAHTEAHHISQVTLSTSLRLVVLIQEKDMRLLPVHTHTFVREPNYRIQYNNNYYISVEGGEFQLAIHSSQWYMNWHRDWFSAWNQVIKY